jgi:hypothetical protein
MSQPAIPSMCPKTYVQQNMKLRIVVSSCFYQCYAGIQTRWPVAVICYVAKTIV